MQKRLDEIVARPKSAAKPQSRPKPAAKVAPKRAGSLKPTLADVAYGPHPKQTLHKERK